MRRLQQPEFRASVFIGNHRFPGDTGGCLFKTATFAHRLQLIAQSHKDVGLMKIKVLTLFGLLAVLSGCAAQRDIVVLEERLIAVENKAMALQRQNERLQGQIQQEVAAIGSESQSKEKNLRSQYASMNVSLESIEQHADTLNIPAGRIYMTGKRDRRKSGFCLWNVLKVFRSR